MAHKEEAMSGVCTQCKYGIQKGMFFQSIVTLSFYRNFNLICMAQLISCIIIIKTPSKNLLSFRMKQPFRYFLRRVALSRLRIASAGDTGYQVRSWSSAIAPCSDTLLFFKREERPDGLLPSSFRNFVKKKKKHRNSKGILQQVKCFENNFHFQ